MDHCGRLSLPGALALPASTKAEIKHVIAIPLRFTPQFWIEHDRQDGSTGRIINSQTCT